ncbi:hypothetical protein ACXGQW_01745 [Wenyingzhuangia sp. IMCC45533]
MNTIKNKAIIGFIFSVFATLVSSLFNHYFSSLNHIIANANRIGINFMIFFLIGYVVLGNLLVRKKQG